MSEREQVPEDVGEHLGAPVWVGMPVPAASRPAHMRPWTRQTSAASAFLGLCACLGGANGENGEEEQAGVRLFRDASTEGCKPPGPQSLPAAQPSPGLQPLPWATSAYNM